MTRHARLTVFATCLCALFGVLSSPSSQAQTAVKVGNSAPNNIAFAWLDIGMAQGIYARHGLAVEAAGFAGGARVDQAIIAGQIDFGLNSGAALASIVKGAPMLGVAATQGAPSHIGIAVRSDLPIRKAEDLKGKKIGISTAGSLTDWLVRELSHQMGWGPDGITTQPLGSAQSNMAAVKLKQIDGMITAVNSAYDLEDKGEMRLVASFGKYVPDFHAAVLFASRGVIDKNPDVVRRFVAASLESIRYMKTQKDETVKFVAKLSNTSESVTARTYDEVISTYSDTGRFDPKALAVLRRSYVQLGLLPQEPDMAPLYTEQFLPGPR